MVVIILIESRIGQGNTWDASRKKRVLNGWAKVRSISSITFPNRMTPRLK